MMTLSVFTRRKRHNPTIRKAAKWIWRWMAQVADPIYAMQGIAGHLWYFVDWHRYARLPGAEVIRLADVYPQVHDRIPFTPVDAHYFYVNGWAMRRIVAQQPIQHVDVGSQTLFANLLGAVVPVRFVDYRPLRARLNGIHSLAGSILQLPFPDRSLLSISCLHVAEHVGLGRYGDPLDPQGTYKAARELSRILAEGGSLYFALPVGKPRLCFNAHRIHNAEAICEYFSPLGLVEFSGVHDDGTFVERVGLSEFKESDFACGFFWFRRG